MSMDQNIAETSDIPEDQKPYQPFRELHNKYNTLTPLERTDMIRTLSETVDSPDALHGIALIAHVLQDIYFTDDNKRIHIDKTVLQGFEEYLLSLGPGVKSTSHKFKTEDEANSYYSIAKAVSDNMELMIGELVQKKGLNLADFPMINRFSQDAINEFRNRGEKGFILLNPYLALIRKNEIHYTDDEMREHLLAYNTFVKDVVDPRIEEGERLDPTVRMARTFEALDIIADDDPFLFQKRTYLGAPTAHNGQSLCLEYLLDQHKNPTEVTDESFEAFGLDGLKYISAIPKADVIGQAIIKSLFLTNQQNRAVKTDDRASIIKYKADIDTMNAWQIWFVKELFAPYVTEQSGESTQNNEFHTVFEKMISGFDEEGVVTFSQFLRSMLRTSATPWARQPQIAPIRQALRERGPEIGRALEARFLSVLPKSEDLRELIGSMIGPDEAQPVESVVHPEVVAQNAERTYYSRELPEGYSAPIYVINEREEAAITEADAERTGLRLETLFAKGRVFEGAARIAQLASAQAHELVIPEVFIRLEKGVPHSTQFSVRADGVVFDPKGNRVVSVFECKNGNARTDICRTIAKHQKALSSSHPDVSYNLIHFEKNGIRELDLSEDNIIDFRAQLMPQLQESAPAIVANLESITASMVALTTQNTSESAELLQLVATHLNQILDEVNNYTVQHIDDMPEALGREKRALLAQKLADLVEHISVGSEWVQNLINTSDSQPLSPTDGHIVTTEGVFRTAITVKKTEEFHERIRSKTSPEIAQRERKLREMGGIEIAHPEVFAALNIETKLPIMKILGEAYLQNKKYTLDELYAKYEAFVVDLPQTFHKEVIAGYFGKMESLGVIEVTDDGQVSLPSSAMNRRIRAGAGHLYSFLDTYQDVLTTNSWTLTDLMGYGSSVNTTVERGEMVTRPVDKLAQEVRCKILYALSSASIPQSISRLSRDLGILPSTVSEHLDKLARAGGAESHGILTIHEDRITEIKHPQMLEDFVLTILFADASTPQVIDEGITLLKGMKSKPTANLIKNAYTRSPYTGKRKQKDVTSEI